MRYYVLYLPTENVNLIKDMGMMPYKLHKMFGYDAYVACYKNGEYHYQEDEVKGLKVDFVEKKYNNLSMDSMRYLRKKAKDIDILQLFSVTLSSFFSVFAYKYYNPSGKIYLKLDCTQQLINKINGLNFFERKIFDAFLNKVDLISAEQEVLYQELRKILGKNSSKLIKVANGVDYDFLNKIGVDYDYSKKENIILNVARIGTEQKNTEMLLEAFKNIKDIEASKWKLVLVGPIEKEFHSYIENFYKENPKLKEKVIFKGPTADRKALYEEYSRAKIFCLSSRPRFESFGIVYVEAAALGDVIVSTDVGIARELVTEKCGAIVPVEDTEALTVKLQEFINKSDLEPFCNETKKICDSNFDWDRIIEGLNAEIIKMLERKDS